MSIVICMFIFALYISLNILALLLLSLFHIIGIVYYSQGELRDYMIYTPFSDTSKP